MLSTLFASRKFLYGLGALVITGVLTGMRIVHPEQFVELLKWISGFLIGGVALEGAAEKWNQPTPAGARAADSLKPPPPFEKITTPFPPPLPLLALVALCSCTQQRALTAAESAQYDIELKGCYDNAKSWAEYNSCANNVDKKHGVKP